MSGSSIDKKIRKGMAIVGRKLGWEFNLYRPDSYVVPIQTRNFQFKVWMSFSQNESFSKNPEDTLDYFTIYTDYGKLQAGDIMHSPELDRTFVIMERVELKGAVGVGADSRVNVLRPVFNMAADKKTSFEEVATTVPCAFEITDTVPDQAGLQGVNSKMSAGQSRIGLWTWVPRDTIRYNDVIEVGGARYLVQDVQVTDEGTKVTGISTKLSV